MTEANVVRQTGSDGKISCSVLQTCTRLETLKTKNQEGTTLSRFTCNMTIKRATFPSEDHFHIVTLTTNKTASSCTNINRSKKAKITMHKQYLVNGIKTHPLNNTQNIC